MSCTGKRYIRPSRWTVISSELSTRQHSLHPHSTLSPPTHPTYTLTQSPPTHSQWTPSRTPLLLPSSRRARSRPCLRAPSTPRAEAGTRLTALLLKVVRLILFAVCAFRCIFVDAQLTTSTSSPLLQVLATATSPYHSAPAVVTICSTSRRVLRAVVGYAV